MDKPVTTQVLPRDKLVGVLHEYIRKNYANTIELRYGYEVEPEDFAADGNTAVSVRYVVVVIFVGRGTARLLSIGVICET